VRIYLAYAFRETASNLRRNPVMTLAAILTVTVSLALFGGGLFARQTAAHAEIVWEQQTQTTVWMKADATQSEIASVKSELANSPFIQGTCTYQDKQQDYREAKEILPAYAISYLPLSSVPESFICATKIPTDDTLVLNTFHAQAGVYGVTSPFAQAQQQQHFIDIATLVLLAISLALLISAAVLIWNTIRLAIFSRRREISVMKLVGATNWFIRIPYVTEGFVQGIVGAIFASIGIEIAHLFVHSQEYAITTGNILGTDAVVVVLGIVIGTLGSSFAIRKYLDV
jgi:cell division transport system permease protein